MSNNNQYPQPPQGFVMKPSHWLITLMVFLYALITLMAGPNSMEWHLAVQIIFCIAELVMAIIFVVCKIHIDEDYLKRDK
jgi:hypothetical protein